MKVTARWLSEIGFSAPLGAGVSYKEIAKAVAQIGGRPLTEAEFLMATMTYPQFVLGDPNKYFILTDEDKSQIIGSKRDPSVPEGFPTMSRVPLDPEDIAVMFMEM